jgi:hypothetical protein
MGRGGICLMAKKRFYETDRLLSELRFVCLEICYGVFDRRAGNGLILTLENQPSILLHYESNINYPS